VSDFDNEQAQRIAKLAAHHVHVIEHVRAASAVLEAEGDSA
jgi:hypothetical protein